MPGDGHEPPSGIDLIDGGAELGATLTGTVRWFKNEKGYGRITGDDDYFYFVHFSDIQMDGYRSLLEGQRVEFEWLGGRADHGRKAASNVRVIEP